MEQIIIITILIAMTFILGIVFNIKLKKIKEIAHKEENEIELETLPEQIEICKEMLKELNNPNVEVVENAEYNASLYTIFNNRITIGKITNKLFTVQTIAHECVHSIQSKRKAWFNFIISNIYILYYYILIISTILNKIFSWNSNIIENTTLNIVILLILAFAQYMIRSVLETEAILESKHLAEKYFKKNGIETKKLERIIKEYEAVNQAGIDIICYSLFVKSSIKLIIYIITSMII